MSEFLPKDEPGLADWFDNWAAKMDDHGAEHGFSAAEILQAKDDAMVVRNIVSGGQAIRAYRLEYVNFKHLMLFGERDAPTPDYPLLDLPAQPAAPVQMAGGVIKRTKSFVRRLRESARYNEAVAADFRVLLPKPNAIVVTEAKPVVKPQVRGDSLVAAVFTKNGFDGIELEVQKGNDARNWTSLGRFYESPAEDTMPSGGSASAMPEVWHYRARYLKGNKPVGVYSDIVSVITMP